MVSPTAENSIVVFTPSPRERPVTWKGIGMGLTNGTCLSIYVDSVADQESTDSDSDQVLLRTNNKSAKGPERIVEGRGQEKGVKLGEEVAIDDLSNGLREKTGCGRVPLRISAYHSSPGDELGLNAPTSILGARSGQPIHLLVDRASPCIAQWSKPTTSLKAVVNDAPQYFKDLASGQDGPEAGDAQWYRKKGFPGCIASCDCVGERARGKDRGNCREVEADKLLAKANMESSRSEQEATGGKLEEADHGLRLRRWDVVIEGEEWLGGFEQCWQPTPNYLYQE
ncbi:hypothetical protein GUITHDRAFT_118310 [Guillardia theta CCMP2712]|uniref:Uncharacterized protein n=1 Tax=Guillardia theta (strain CCMP2712) TaxID=905079 RepID=L1IHC9_GUITC|nr:hypothetical protein GUITHDRAFT_118310 [Guillardia theta CCMP2712]EKX35497.1 hypothetical protein GUITHDRAFT_118310 [Guillardia theta CCMP2712]|eukprot:XP_005822477.1 hypothetical protein GUITHDRAFT_118310 [Guillardia theta CCMP2712]